jgi:hypothetical protein
MNYFRPKTLTLELKKASSLNMVTSEYTEAELSNEDVKCLLVEIYLIYGIILTRYLEQKTYNEHKQKILRKNHTNGISLPYLQEILKHVDWVGYLSIDRFKMTPLYESLSKSNFSIISSYKSACITSLILRLEHSYACTETNLILLQTIDPLEWFFESPESEMITLTPKLLCLMDIIDRILSLPLYKS